jgi:small subunit ribosomal protein S13
LTAVYGIGRNKSKEILDRLSIPLEKKVKDLTDKEVKSITDELRELILENDLRREVS